MSETYTTEQVREAALEAADRIIRMVLKGCQRRQLTGMPNVNGKVMGWDDYVAHTVCECLPEDEVVASSDPARPQE